jgi:hypothetical protein
MAVRSSPQRAPRKRKASELIISLDEFASICGVTAETMRSHLKQAPADAEWLIERGRRGVGYKIRAADAVAWWKSRSNSGGDDDIRRAQLAEWRLTALGDAGDDEGLGLTGKQRFDEYRAGEAELAYRQAIGELCRAADIEEETVNAVIELRRQLQGVGPIIRHKFKLDKEVQTAIDEEIASRLAAFIKVLDVDADA